MKIQHNKPWNIHRMGIIVTVLYVISILPLLILSFFSYPVADDFAMAVDVHAVYAATGSFLQTIAKDFAMAWHYYTKWCGYYTSDLLMAMPPSVFGEQFYRIGTFLLLGMLSFGTIYFLHALLVKAYHVQADIFLCITMILLFLTVQCMPQGAVRVEAFYWYSGAINYLFLYGLELVYLGLLISAVCESGSKRRYDVIMASVIGFLMGGANYMSALSCAIISGLLLLYLMAGSVRAIRRKFSALFVKDVRQLLIPSVIMLAGFFCSCLAPGNKYRAVGFQKMNPVKAILMSLHYTLSYAINEWTTWAVICLLLIIAVLFWKALERTKHRFDHPVLAVLFLYGMASANITPSLYAEGNIGAGRIQSIFWTQFILCLTLAAGYVTGWIHQHMEEKAQRAESTLSEPEHLSSAASGFILAVVLFGIFGSLMAVKVNPHFYTATSAVADLGNGSAESYARTWEERYKVLHDTGVRNVTFDALSKKPALLFFSDVAQDPKDWANLAMCEYYGKDSIVSITAKQ